MALALLFEVPGYTQEHYDQVIETLQRGGKTAEGRIFHLAGPMEGGWRFLDVWESQEAADKFFQEALRPAAQQVGFALAQPRQVWPVHICLIGPEHHL
jgi:hypothetical protein